MTTNRRRVRRTATLTMTVAAITLTAGLLTACDPTDTSDTSGASGSLNCLKNWNTISDSLKAIDDAEGDPTRAAESLAKIHADADDTKVDKAVDDLNKAISDYNKSILNGDTNPDTGRIDAAASRLKDVCTS